MFYEVQLDLETDTIIKNDIKRVRNVPILMDDYEQIWRRK